LDSLRLVKYIFLALLLILGWGSIGYMLIENVPFLDALYMTLITITTVGYNEIFPLSHTGRLFTMLLIVCGVGVILISFGVLTQVAVEGSLRRIVGRKRMENKIEKLKGHYVLCGCGRIGHMVFHEMMDRHIPVVVIDHKQEIIEQLTDEGSLAILGSATEEETLERANVKQARGLVVTVSSDAEAVFIILSVRDLNPDLFIIARAIEEGNERKLIQAGANRVISPYRLVGKRVTNAILRPAVIDMLDTLMFESDLDLVIEGTEVYADSPLAGVTLRDSGIRQKLGLIIIGIQKGEGNILFNPQPNEVIAPGDTLISIGDKNALRKLAELLRGKGGTL